MSRPPYRYGDFPELFWDAQRDAVIEPDNLVMLSRVLRLGSLDSIRKLIDFDIVRRRWDELWLPEEAGYVWGQARPASPRAEDPPGRPCRRDLHI